MFHIKYFPLKIFFYSTLFNFRPLQCHRSDIEIFTWNTLLKNTTTDDAMNLVLRMLDIILSHLFFKNRSENSDKKSFPLQIFPLNFSKYYNVSLNFFLTVCHISLNFQCHTERQSEIFEV